MHEMQDYALLPTRQWANETSMRQGRFSTFALAFRNGYQNIVSYLHSRGAVLPERFSIASNAVTEINQNQNVHNVSEDAEVSQGNASMVSKKALDKEPYEKIPVWSEALYSHEAQLDFLNQLRIAAKIGNIAYIRKIIENFTSDEYFALMSLRNEPYSKYCIIHYAICFNQPSAIKELLKGMTLAQRLAICNRGITDVGCNVLHIAVNNNLYEAAEAIRAIFFESNEISSWIKLFTECEHTSEETPAHYAARRGDLKFLEIFSRELSSQAWYSILTKKNIDGRNALKVYLINTNETSSSPGAFKIIQGPMENVLWLDLLNPKNKEQESVISYVKSKFNLSYFEINQIEPKENLLVNWTPRCYPTHHGPHI